MKTMIARLFLALSGVVMLAASCKKPLPKEQSPAAEGTKSTISLQDQQMGGVRLDQVRKMPVAEQFTTVGEVSFDEDNVVRIYPIVSGTVEKVSVSLGDYVQRGQLLAVLLSTDITTFQRNYNVAKENLEIADKNMTRSKELYQNGMMSEKDFAEDKRDYVNALSEFNEKKQILELYGGSFEILDATFRVVAPRSGYIVERNINEGTQIRTDNNTAIFTISDLKTVWIWAKVHESDISKLKENDKVMVTTVAYPDLSMEGKIKKIGTMLDPSSRVIRARVELPNESGLLKPEMFATMTITSQETKQALAVQQKALVLENNEYYVMRQTTKNTFEKVRVSASGKKFNQFTEITSGLNAGDSIVVDGALFVLSAYNLK